MIKEFQKENRWLSNFAPCKIILNGIEFKSVEHAYMSAKSEKESWKLFCSLTESPGKVKKASRNIELIHNWENIKVFIMNKCLKQKFTQEPFMTKLISTGCQDIQEGNWWGDKFWGICLKTNKGKNILGKLIMTIRENIYTSSM